MHRVGFADFQPTVCRNIPADLAQRHLVEGRGVVHHAPVAQGREAGVEVIEPLIDQAQRHDFDIQRFADRPVRFQRASHAVARPQNRTFIASGLKQRVAFAFEGRIGRQIQRLVARSLKPFGKQRHLRLALGHPERSRHEPVTDHQPGVGREAHVRQMLAAIDHLHVGQPADNPVQHVPLLGGHFASRPAHVAFHPRVDHVLHAEMRRSAHENLAAVIHEGTPTSWERMTLTEYTDCLQPEPVSIRLTRGKTFVVTAFMQSAPGLTVALQMMQRARRLPFVPSR